MFSVNLDKETNTILAQVVENKFSQQVQVTVAEVSKALLGKDHQIRLALCCLFSGGAPVDRRFAGNGQDDSLLCAGQSVKSKIQPHSIYQ